MRAKNYFTSPAHAQGFNNVLDQGVGRGDRLFLSY
jgi:hypothetical protein